MTRTEAMEILKDFIQLLEYGMPLDGVGENTTSELLIALRDHIYPCMLEKMQYDACLELYIKPMMNQVKKDTDIQDFKLPSETTSDKPIWTHCSEELNDKICELMGDYQKLVEKAKSFGLDIRLYDQSETLVLYYNDDYPDTLLVDKDSSSEKRK